MDELAASQTNNHRETLSAVETAVAAQMKRLGKDMDTLASRTEAGVVCGVWRVVRGP